MKRLLPLLLLAVPSLSSAHFLWASLDTTTKTASIGLQETPDVTPLPLAARAAAVKVWSQVGKPLTLRAEGTWLRTSAEDRVGASLDYGVLDKTAEGRGVFWLRYYAKAAANAAASQTNLKLPVELTATKDATGHWTVTVKRDGKPAAGADVVIEGAGAFTGKTGPDGTVVLPSLGDTLAVRALVTDATKGSLDGKAYELIRSYSTLTVGNPNAPKPFTRLIQAALGDNHDVVSHSAFIETVKAKQLTKAQLELHLQQRTLVHEALDKILLSAKGVPYGEQQKEVLTLIKADLKSLGVAEPTAARATPLTRDFLKEIETSAKESPYFALGVFHVYFGGITNGGRGIGAIIGSTVGFTPTYYEKSDGYRPYLEKINLIEDPAARSETIRGALAAYKYIIATNNEAAFKS